EALRHLQSIGSLHHVTSFDAWNIDPRAGLYASVPDSTQRRNTSTFSFEHAPSQGIEPFSSRRKISGACRMTSRGPTDRTRRASTDDRSAETEPRMCASYMTGSVGPGRAASGSSGGGDRRRDPGGELEGFVWGLRTVRAAGWRAGPAGRLGDLRAVAHDRSRSRHRTVRLRRHHSEHHAVFR